MPQSGIYTITNSVTGDVYVGSSSNIQSRWSHHLSDLRKGTHHSSRLQRAFTKYGEKAFVFALIEEVPIDAILLLQREQYWLDTLQPAYNARKQAERNSGIARPDMQTEQAREKFRAMRAKSDAEGKAHGGPPKGLTKHIELLQQLNTGRKIQRSPEASRKSGETRKGQKRPPEAVEASRKAHLGTKDSFEVRQKKREAAFKREAAKRRQNKAL